DEDFPCRISRRLLRAGLPGQPLHEIREVRLADAAPKLGRRLSIDVGIRPAGASSTKLPARGLCSIARLRASARHESERDDRDAEPGRRWSPTPPSSHASNDG